MGNLLKARKKRQFGMGCGKATWRKYLHFCQLLESPFPNPFGHIK